VSACDGTGTLGCPGCSQCRRPAHSGSGGYHSVLPPAALRTPEWLAEQLALEARIRAARNQEARP